MKKTTLLAIVITSSITAYPALTKAMMLGTSDFAGSIGGGSMAEELEFAFTRGPFCGGPLFRISWNVGPENVGDTIFVSAETNADFEIAAYVLSNGVTDCIMFETRMVGGGGGGQVGTDCGFFTKSPGIDTEYCDFHCCNITAISLTVNAFTIHHPSDSRTNYTFDLTFKVWGDPPIPKPAMIYYVDADADGANNGSSWADAFNFLQDALDAAWSGDEILVAQGIYKPDQGAGITPGDREATFQLINGVTIKGGYAGEGSPDPNTRDIQLYETILSGDLDGNDVEVNDPCDLENEPTRAENSYHLVFAGYWTDANAVLDGFIITGGNANGSYPYPSNCGGGMFNHHDSSPTLRNCKFISNSADWHGGAIHNKGGPMLTNCVLTGNSAELGGGISTAHSEGLTSIINCIISGNIASEDGGGMRSWESDAVVVNSKIVENSAHDRGGGIYMDENSNMVLTGCTVSRNKAEGGDGGGLYSRWYSYPLITNCIFWENSDIGGVDESAQISGSDQINYSCIQGWTGILGGTDNIGDDPLFLNPNNGDYHLLPGSPCIDAGDPNYMAEPNETDLDGNPRVIGCRIDMGAYEAPILAEARILPRTINLASKGNWITCYIWLPEQYNVADIEPNSIFLEEQIKAEQLLVNEQERVAIARFDREDVQSILDIGEVELTITGRLTDGAPFEATDLIKVIEKGSRKSAN